MVDLHSPIEPDLAIVEVASMRTGGRPKGLSNLLQDKAAVANIEAEYDTLPMLPYRSLRASNFLDLEDLALRPLIIST